VSEPTDLRDLMGESVSPEELAALRRVDTLLRAVPAPPAEVPSSLTRAVAGIPRERSLWTRRRLVLSAALAAVVAASAFGLGRWTAGEEEFARATVTMSPTAEAPGGTAVIRIGERDDASGNWGLELDVSGLPPLAGGDYYVLWLEKDGEYAATCGTFNVGPGRTTVELTVSYRLADYDAWVISEHDGDAPLLRAEIDA
jgi:hypothetical protein